MSSIDDGADEQVTYALRLHERAVRDINAAFVRLAEMVSEEHAYLWRDGLRNAIASVAARPRRFPLARERFRREVRQLLYARVGSKTTYRILFTITGETADSLEAPTVTILHIRHASARPITRNKAREIDSEG